MQKKTTIFVLLFFVGCFAGKTQGEILEIDRSLYQRITSLNETWERDSDGRRVFPPVPIPGNYKIDFVFITTWQSPFNPENEIYFFFDPNDRHDVGSGLEAPKRKFELIAGQLVTVYFRQFPGEVDDRGSFTVPTLITHIEIPAVGFTFSATHRATANVDVKMVPWGDGRIIFSLTNETEVQIIEEIHRPIFSWANITTADGFAGWVNLTSLEPIAGH